MKWEALGGGLFNPVAISSGPGRLTLLARSSNNELLLREWQDEAWREPRSLGNPIARVGRLAISIPADWPLAACPSGGPWPHLLARGPDGELLHCRGDEGGERIIFEYVGAPAALAAGRLAIPMGLGGPPSACSPSPNRVHVFAAGHGGSLLHAVWDGEAWGEFESLGAPMLGDSEGSRPYLLSGPVSCCSAGDQIAVFIRGPVGDLLMKWWDGTQWNQFESLGSPRDYDSIYPAVTVPVPLTGHPTACSWGPSRLDVFARGSHGDMLHRSWNGNQWGQFESLRTPSGEGGTAVPFVGMATACSWGQGRLDVFARALDGQLYHAWWDGSWEHN